MPLSSTCRRTLRGATGGKHAKPWNKTISPANKNGNEKGARQSRPGQLWAGRRAGGSAGEQDARRHQQRKIPRVLGFRDVSQFEWSLRGCNVAPISVIDPNLSRTCGRYVRLGHNSDGPLSYATACQRQGAPASAAPTAGSPRGQGPRSCAARPSPARRWRRPTFPVGDSRGVLPAPSFASCSTSLPRPSSAG